MKLHNTQRQNFPTCIIQKTEDEIKKLTLRSTTESFDLVKKNVSR